MTKPMFDTYNQEGEKTGQVEQPDLFQVPVDDKLILRYYNWVRSVLRDTIAHTKTRGEVSGGGKKPWRQKGTGRARVGSTRSPLWRKGGVVFGPRKNQNWATRMPRMERRKALFSALSSKAAQNKVLILEDWLLESPKTKLVTATLSKLPTMGKNILHIHKNEDSNLFLSTRNLPNIKSVTVPNLNIIELLNHEAILLTKESLKALEEHFSARV